MNTSQEILISNLSTANLPQNTYSQFLIAIAGANFLGMLANGLLIVGLVLLRRAKIISDISVQMLLQQAIVDFLTCAIIIPYAQICRWLWL